MEEADFLHDKKLFPRKERTSRGDKFWDTHRASQYLHYDVKIGAILNMKPSDVQKTRPEYLEFSPLYFRKAYFKEIHKQLTGPYWAAKRNKKARQKIEDEMDEMKNEWGVKQAYNQMDEMMKGLTLEDKEEEEEEEEEEEL